MPDSRSAPNFNLRGTPLVRGFSFGLPVVTVTVLIPPMPGSKAPLPRDVRAGALKIRQVSEIMQVSVREQLLLQANSLPLLLSLAFLGHLSARFSPLCRLPALLFLPHLQLEAVWPLFPLEVYKKSVRGRSAVPGRLTRRPGT